ncbi:BILE ACID-SODIUM SYMPORTER FAMILY PROTEIN [Klebsormidium nitens]|uniref:BILE ACID-SODIUM SYMPORTER FAMILY PROTEIN n=1 Tax=Klebsormidium nitens TaxID=105231 RepID=A0A1Y1I6N5_KLENI|nr:BILE ACID-SODIUM SYMPORTER FAMILY PROTEIN [Klebsormidium nitens]|eukprot:GAQ84801.1 BILE ACID-SODIUM SYMPORTER FAMILY PROTEIN [Klebsormidium nitens]
MHVTCTYIELKDNADKRTWQDWLGLATSLYPVYVSLGALLAVVRPSSFAWFCAGGPTLYSSALGIIMLSMGLTMGWEDLRALLLGHPAAIAFGFAAQYVLMPLLGLVVSHALGLPSALAAGVVLLSCCPGGTASNVVTLIGYGDVPLSIMMTICTTFGAVIMTPFLMQTLAGTLVPIDAAGLALSTLQVVLLPVLLGMTCKNYFPRAVEKVLPFAPLTAVLTSSLLASSVFSANVPLFQLPSGAAVQAALGTASLASDAVLPLGRIVAAVFLVHAGGFGLGYLVAVLAGFKEARRRAISIEVGMQNASLGVVLATKHFASPLTPLPCAISAIMMNVMGSSLAVAWRRQGAPRETDAVDTSLITEERS